MKVLGVGDRLGTEKPVWDESSRFELILQQDGNLVVYAYLTEPKVYRQAIGATGTGAWGPDLEVTLELPATIVFRQIFTGARHIFYQFPSAVVSYPNAQLILQADGNLVYYADGVALTGPLWSTGAFDPAQRRNAVPPNTLVIDIDGVISSSGDKTIINDTSTKVAVRDNTSIVVLPPSGRLAASSSLSIPGNMTLSGNTYDFTSTESNSTNVECRASIGPSTTDIHVSQSTSGFALS